ncbi:MAG: hypothetical protein WC832_01505 [Anaerolineales bacterium]
MLLDIDQYIHSLRPEKYRSVIIHHNDLPVLKEFFIQSTEITSGFHIDVLKQFQDHDELIKSLDSFSVSKLKNLLVKLCQGNSVVFLSNLDFLLDTWGTPEKLDFATLIEKQWNSFYSENTTTLIFGLQTDYWLEQLTILDNKGRSRVHKLNEFKAIL